jgi:hypothetical protein
LRFAICDLRCAIPAKPVAEGQPQRAQGGKAAAKDELGNQEIRKKEIRKPGKQPFLSSFQVTPA